MLCYVVSGGPRPVGAKVRAEWMYVTPNLPTNITATNIAWLKLSGKFPMDMRIPPLWIKIVKPSVIHNVSREIGRMLCDVMRPVRLLRVSISKGLTQAGS